MFYTLWLFLLSKLLMYVLSLITFYTGVTDKEEEIGLDISMHNESTVIRRTYISPMCVLDPRYDVGAVMCGYPSLTGATLNCR